MREAKTVKDVAELLSDYDVFIHLTENRTITFHFPIDKKYHHDNSLNKKRLEAADRMRDDDSVKISRKVRYTIRSLVENPQFGRCTTVADQLSCFCQFHNEDFGKPTLRKKAGEPLTMVFNNKTNALKFYRALKKTKLFKKKEVSVI